MSENKFTPGPWETGDDYQVQTVDKHGFEIAEIRIDVPEYEANALLIAAAPDLLEALEYMCSIGVTVPHCNSVNAMDKAHAAIARARGEA